MNQLTVAWLFEAHHHPQHLQGDHANIIQWNNRQCSGTDNKQQNSNTNVYHDRYSWCQGPAIASRNEWSYDPLDGSREAPTLGGLREGDWEDTHPVGKTCAQSVPEPWLSPVPLEVEGGPDSRGRREGDWEDGCRVRQSGPKPWRMEGCLRRVRRQRAS